MLLGLGTSNYLPFVLNFLDILYCGAKVVLLKYKPNPDRLQVKTLEWLLKCTPYLEPGSEWFLPHSLLILPSRFWIFKHDSLLRTSSPLGLRLYIIMYQYSQSLHALVTTSLSGAWFGSLAMCSKESLSSLFHLWNYLVLHLLFPDEFSGG